MCLSCGCGEPNKTHGNPDHITMQNLEKAARAANISPEQAARNISQGLQQAGGMSGQHQSSKGGQSQSGTSGQHQSAGGQRQSGSGSQSHS